MTPTFATQKFSKPSFVRPLILAACLLMISGCNPEADLEDQNGPNGRDKVDGQNLVVWDSVPRQFNPSVDEYSFSIKDIDRVSLNIFNFSRDVRALRSTTLSADQVHLRLYKVWQNFASWGPIRSSLLRRQLAIGGEGSYQCSIKIENRQITELNGGCYVRAELMVPAASQVEIFNIGRKVEITNP